MSNTETPAATGTVLLRTDAYAAGLGQVFAFEAAPDTWVVARWGTIPDLGNTAWFPHYWNGPVGNTWHGTADGQVPPDAQFFDSLEAASAAYASADH